MAYDFREEEEEEEEEELNVLVGHTSGLDWGVPIVNMFFLSLNLGYHGCRFVMYIFLFNKTKCI